MLLHLSAALKNSYCLDPEVHAVRAAPEGVIPIPRNLRLEWKPKRDDDNLPWSNCNWRENSTVTA